jgi:fibronectin type 3 domain-containing protein
VADLTVYPDVITNDAILRWTAIPRANSYKVYRGTTYGFVVDGSSYIGQTASTTYTDVGQLSVAGTKFFYVVVASEDVIGRGR